MLPENADKKTVSWSTSDTKIATVHRVTGNVTAKAEGTAIITAEADDFAVTCMVTVRSVDDGVDQVEREKDALEVYDIVGRPLKQKVKSAQELDPGIYIINGRKTVVK